MGDPRGHAATRILVVDDDPSIRLLCKVNLELDGHEVLEAHSLDSARATLADEEVDVIVLDVHLHRERSDPLVTECHARRPPIPGVLVTGSGGRTPPPPPPPPPIPVVLVTGSVELTHPALREADAVLPKPFELDQLLSAVRNLA